MKKALIAAAALAATANGAFAVGIPSAAPAVPEINVYAGAAAIAALAAVVALVWERRRAAV